MARARAIAETDLTALVPAVPVLPHAGRGQPAWAHDTIRALAEWLEEFLS